MSFYGQYRKLSQAELKEKARNTIEKLRSKGQELQPVEITGRHIATSWWAKAWVDNLDRYADWDYRVDRGKSYVRANCVIDLRVSRGKILGQVIGTRSNPYQVHISIDPMHKANIQTLLDSINQKAESLEKLILGDFPETLKDKLYAAKDGIFPSVDEIHLSCNCPDYADLCKHAASVLLSLAPRIDSNPTVLFELRGIDMNDFIQTSVSNIVSNMVSNANQPSQRILTASDEELSQIFGVI
ncbi:MAG: SWIM zinc finger family protein [Cardiobacteriaceae bacterium]|nr:SWIM zinc finger family protein [Cardiobacteriaceae bacterium]